MKSVKEGERILRVLAEMDFSQLTSQEFERKISERNRCIGETVGPETEATHPRSHDTHSVAMSPGRNMELLCCACHAESSIPPECDPGVLFPIILPYPL